MGTHTGLPNRGKSVPATTGRGTRTSPVPLKHRDLNVLGRYSFASFDPAAGTPRPLHNPDTTERDDEEVQATLAG